MSRDYRDIIAGCNKKDRTSQNELFARFAPIMLSICLRYLKDQPRAEDALIKGFKKVYDHLKDYSGTGSLEGWIKRIVINECLMILRKDKKHQRIVSIDEAPPQEVYLNDHLAYEELLSLLDHLPTGYRTVFNLYAIEGYKHREIAELLGISINTSKSQLILARKKLQAMIKKKENYKWRA